MEGKIKKSSYLKLGHQMTNGVRLPGNASSPSLPALSGSGLRG